MPINPAAVREILQDALLRAALQAFLLASHDEGGVPVKTLAGLVGVSQATMYRWLAKRRGEKVKNPKVDLIYRAAAASAGPCDHPRAFWVGRKKVCLDCLCCNFQQQLDRDKRFGLAAMAGRKQSPHKFRAKGRKAPS